MGKITLQHEIQQQQQPRSKVNSYLNFTQKLTYVWVYFLIFFLKMFINEMRSVLFFPLFSNDSSCLACVPVWLRWMHLISSCWKELTCCCCIAMLILMMFAWLLFPHLLWRVEAIELDLKSSMFVHTVIQWNGFGSTQNYWFQNKTEQKNEWEE